MITCVHLIQKDLVPLPYFWQPSTRALDSHDLHSEIFSIYPARGSLDLLWSMQTGLSLCSLLLDGSTKTQQHGLIFTAVTKTSDSNELLLSPESVNLLPLQDSFAVETCSGSSMEGSVSWWVFYFKNTFTVYIIVIPIFTILALSRSFLNLLFMPIATSDARKEIHMKTDMNPFT